MKYLSYLVICLWIRTWERGKRKRLLEERRNIPKWEPFLFPSEGRFLPKKMSFPQSDGLSLLPFLEKSRLRRLIVKKGIDTSKTINAWLRFYFPLNKHQTKPKAPSLKTQHHDSHKGGGEERETSQAGYLFYVLP